ncbi:hypothetical protein Tco_0168285 [Tanacetum coccineum]
MCMDLMRIRVDCKDIGSRTLVCSRMHFLSIHIKGNSKLKIHRLCSLTFLILIPLTAWIEKLLKDRLPLRKLRKPFGIVEVVKLRAWMVTLLAFCEEVIKVYHGQEGGFDTNGCSFKGIWANIVGTSNFLHSKVKDARYRSGTKYPSHSCSILLLEDKSIPEGQSVYVEFPWTVSLL